MKKAKVVQVRESIRAKAHERIIGDKKTKEEIIGLFDDLMNDPLSPAINSRELKIKYMYEHKYNNAVLTNLFNQSKTDLQICAFIVMTTNDKTLLQNIAENAANGPIRQEAKYRLKYIISGRK